MTRSDVEKEASTTATTTALDTSLSSTPSPARSVHGFKWFVVVLSILSSLGLYALDNTIIANIVPAIVESLGDTEQLAWLSVGFTAGGLCLLLPLGKIFSMFDAKWIYISSVTLFMVGSALCGVAPNMNVMIVGRFIAGVGGNGVYLGCVTLLSRTTTPRERPVYLSLNGLVWGIGTILGPIIGGLFELVTWRWAFYINLVIGGALAPVWIIMLPSLQPETRVSLKQRLATFDFLGTALVVVMLMAWVFAMDFGGRLFAWNSGPSVALFVIASVFTIIFGGQQTLEIWTNPMNKLFPTHFMKNGQAVILATIAAAIDVTTFVPIYYIPLYFQFTRGDNAIQSAVRLLPYITTLSATMLANGSFMSKYGHFKLWYVVGSAMATVAAVLLSTVTEKTATAQIYGFEILLGVGCGAFVQAGYAVLFTLLDPKDVAFGTSFMMLAQLSGITFGLAIASAIFIDQAVRSISEVMPALMPEQVELAIQGASGSFFSTLDSTTQTTLIHLLVRSLRKTFIPCYVGAALCFFLSIFIQHRQMHADKTSVNSSSTENGGSDDDR